MFYQNNPYYNPYMQNMYLPNQQMQPQQINPQIQPQVQTQQQQVQNNSLYGRVINNPQEILAKEVPMDGSIGYFPTQDQKCIFAKAWTSDGRIETAVYKLVETEQQHEPNLTELINQRFDRLEKIWLGDGKNE